MAQAFEQFEQAFGMVVKLRRCELGLSQEKLAASANLHRTYISQIERGMKSPSLNSLIALAHALEIAPHQLIKNMENYLTEDTKRGE